MSRFGEAILLSLCRLAPAMHSDLIAAKEDAGSFSEWEYARSVEVIDAYGPKFVIRGRHVLDLGTGLGGKLVYYQQLEPASITTVEIRPDRSAAARVFVIEKGASEGIRFVASNAATLPFDEAAFDVVISNEAFEHIQQPLPALREISRVTRPEGWVFVSFPPYYAPWGAHLNNWIAWPWMQVIFSEQTLINAAVALEEEQQLNRRLMPEGRLDLRGCKTLPHINKMTLGRFEAMLSEVPLRLVRKSYLGLEWRRRPGWYPLVQPLTRLPALCEMFTSHAVYVLRK